MKNWKKITLSLTAFIVILLVSSYTMQVKKDHQTINLFVTHGHCSTPFSGVVENLSVSAPERSDMGNPLEHLALSFEVDPNSFNDCSGEELTNRIKTPGVFIGEKDEKIIFKSTNAYTMGLDWYQINGTLSIKGVEKDVKLFATGIRFPESTKTKTLVVEGQMNLLDWGIDYDKIVNGTSDIVPTKWMYLNMKVELN